MTSTIFSKYLLRISTADLAQTSKISIQTAPETNSLAEWQTDFLDYCGNPQAA